MSSKAPSRQDVDAWLKRIDDVSEAVHDILTEDPVAAEEQRREREAARAAEEARERREKVLMRYDPRYYARFESDEVIDRMLRDADAAPFSVDISKRFNTTEGSSTADRVSLEEALRAKDEAARAVRAGDWPLALSLYDRAVTLSAAPDAALHVTLRNNRALALLKVGRDADALADVDFVLCAEPRNVKALLRRATALRRLRRPLEALENITAALALEPSNMEAQALRKALRSAAAEHRSCEAFERDAPEAAAKLREAAATLKMASAICGRPPKSDTMSLEEEHNALTCDKMCDSAMASCLAVVHSAHRGAAVFVALSGGVRTAAMALRRRTSDPRLKSSRRGSGRTHRNFAVAARLVASLVRESEVAAAEISDGDAADIARRVAESAVTVKDDTAAAAAFDVLCAMATRYESAAQALGPSAQALVNRSYAPVEQYAAMVMPLLLHHCCALITALLRRGVELHKSVVPVALQTAPVFGVDCAALELAAAASATGGDALAEELRSAQFTEIFDRAAAGKLTPRAEEALYAAVYNLLLRAGGARGAYVAQWARAPPKGESLQLRAWRALRERAVGCAVAAKMAAVVAKFAPHDDALRRAVLSDEETLWALLRRAVTAIGAGEKEGTKNTEGTEGTEDYEDCEDSEGGEVAAAWELVEHTTTLVASLYAGGHLSRDAGLSAPARIEALLNILRSTQGGEHLVAVGNAALIVSYIPPAVSGLLAKGCAVDVLLERLRNVRQFIFALEHDGKKESTQWTHAESAQKNLAIALSKCCADESQKERLRELRGFETLHAILGKSHMT